MRTLNDFYDLLPTFVGIWICFLKAIGIHWKTGKVSMSQCGKLFFMLKKIAIFLV